jgi:LmbE family N-acetylglucosaminyl deacetylase
MLITCNTTPKEMQDSVADSNETSPKTIMAIFAHPDDETTIGPVLAKYASLSNVHLVVSTDGRYGVNDHSGIPAGDSLVAIRKKETECACAALGINPPHFLEAKDGLGLNGHHDYYSEVGKLKERILEKIVQLKPDVILTFGPDGDTGHSDHRLVGMLTTEILLREGWANQIDLYYFGWTKDQIKKFPVEWGLGYVHLDHLNTVITFNPEDEEIAFTSLRCHKSQFTEEAMTKWILAEQNDSTNVLYFRKFEIDSVKTDRF